MGRIARLNLRHPLSEKVMYRQVLDLYATSVDYNPKSIESVTFFRMVQNKFYYVVHNHTAAEVVCGRADITKLFTGLTVFQGDFPTAEGISVARNYLNSEELKALNSLASGYFDFAESQTTRRRSMHMSDHAEHLDRIPAADGGQVLEGGGTVSHKQAMDKARQEHRKFRNDNPSPVEQEYLQTIKSTAARTDKKPRTAS